MPEHQAIEWKSSWDNEYLKWICGYANAYGGTLYIGKDDNGKVLGITDSKKLLKNIPDKITHTMGIIADVNLLYEGKREYIEIIVEKYPSLISYHGKYYYRSGSTMRTIDGKELENLLLKQHGRTWDSVPIPKVTATVLRQDAIKLFKEKAVKKGRLTLEDVNVDDNTLLENLRLFDDDGNLIRAALMAFHEDPEKWVFGAYIKIGYFVTDSDLRYQDSVHGSLIEQVDKTMELLYTKYLKALIDYEGIQRVEQFMFHPDAFREILLNAIIHKDYSSCNPIQISVYDDKIYIWNDGKMPPELDSTEKLFAKHSSKPFNPRLANVFFKSGMIEAWGRGFDNIKAACVIYDNAPLPEYNITESGVMVLCKPSERYLRLNNTGNTIASDKASDIGARNGVRNDNGARSGVRNSARNNFGVRNVVRNDSGARSGVRNEDKQLILINLIQNNPFITSAKMSELSNIPLRTVQRIISKLSEDEIIEHIGPTKKGQWVINEQKLSVWREKLFD